MLIISKGNIITYRREHGKDFGMERGRKETTSVVAGLRRLHLPHKETALCPYAMGFNQPELKEEWER